MARLPDPQNIQGHRASYPSEKKGTAIRIEIKEGEGQMTILDAKIRETLRAKKCPFCGGEARLWHPKEYGITLGSVKCNSCGGSTESFSDDDSAIEAWNNRPNPWHTGTPTEEGWYLQRIKSKIGITYDTDYYENGDWKYSCVFREILAWQKIEEGETRWTY